MIIIIIKKKGEYFPALADMAHYHYPALQQNAIYILSNLYTKCEYKKQFIYQGW